MRLLKFIRTFPATMVIVLFIGHRESSHCNDVPKTPGKISSDKTAALVDIIQIAVKNIDIAASDFLYFETGKDCSNQLMDSLSQRKTAAITFSRILNSDSSWARAFKKQQFKKSLKNVT